MYGDYGNREGGRGEKEWENGIKKGAGPVENFLMIYLYATL